MKSYGITDKGLIRNRNEDSIFLSDKPIGILNNLFIVADGVGGRKRGDVASAYATEKFCEYIYEAENKEKDELKLLEEGIKEINKYINYKSVNQYEFNGMATTFLTMTMNDEDIYIANVGDSRLYVVDNQSIRQITEDNTYFNEMKKVSDVKVHGNMKNTLTKSVGFLNTLQVDKYKIERKKNVKILMCSDGLTDMLSDEEIFAECKKSVKIDECAKVLVEMAKDKGGKDNISIILIES